MPWLTRSEKPVAHQKPHLPQKTCLGCQRPFVWRKKWERNWDEVKFCSKRCRTKGRANPASS
ncbi:MAG: DUF2256 domain-containing protein [Alphaproteobacteria bacterium]|nr:DUF2256 domain-containing protein [Henriciella sp.]MCH9751986.1 DUF2256 domain-containing protein [Alphaproteobacteria bacterium]